MKFRLSKRGLIGISITFLVIISLFISAFVVWGGTDEPVDAPEMDAVLEAQRTLPFQILIPAYLPKGFERLSLRIQTDLTGPQGEQMVKLEYDHPKGVTLTFYEWMPDTSVISGSGEVESIMPAGAQMCTCLCQQSGQCSVSSLMVDNGSLRVRAESSDLILLSPEHIQLILSTLAPASGLLTYSNPDEISITTNLPPAEEILINADGVQEVILVVSSNTYTPVHFSVVKDIPVRVVFRQLGEVGCGNELYMTWGKEENGYIYLENINDTQVLEFTPKESGDFLYFCPHFIYQGVMTVID